MSRVTPIVWLHYAHVTDLSAGGARLDLPDPDRLPSRFVLVHDTTRKSGRIV